MKRLLLFPLLLLATALHASHNIAGEIYMRCVSGTTYEITIVTYTNVSSSNVDRCELVVDWGDGGPTSTVPRVNGTTGGDCGPVIGMGDALVTAALGYPGVKQNIYRGQHNYPGANTYNVSISDPNRVNGISNIINSGSVPFFLQTTLVIDPNVGCNSTPVLSTMPLDKACVGSCFYHNPGASDPDGDSLSYSIGPCLDTNGIPLVGYTPIPATIDPTTGDLAWCSPTNAGTYNLVVYISEWKRFPNGARIKIGTVLRDMSIEVLGNCNNDNPVLPALPDLCVDAGQTINFSFPVTDPNTTDQVKLQGFGGPFSATNPATVAPANTFMNVPFTATFNWATTCNEVRLLPWTVNFKATDNGNPVMLVDIESVNITVVSPGPAFLNANPQGSSMHLNWGQNPCDPVNNFCKGYKIYRRQGPSGWTPSQCETGVPGYTGFVLIGTVNGITNTNFIDDNGGAGLIPGLDYCYRVCAYFYDGAESYASPEACNELKRDVPVITNVDVMTTNTNGQIFVRWINALANGVDFDTIQNPGPWKLELERCTGYNYISANATQVATFTSAYFTQLATTYIDNVNTVDTAYAYRLTFYYTDPVSLQYTAIGSCPAASSVFLTATPSDNTVTLSWQYNVPWTNYEFAIYRFNTSTSLWDSIALSPGSPYRDSTLQNGVQYCYYVTAHGSYFNATLPPVMYNRSQQTCATPVDLTPPCPPVLTIYSDCYNNQNQLVWTNPVNMSTCNTDDVVGYNIWYAPVENDPLQLIATVTSATDTVLLLDNLSSVAGCYAVTALDTFNNQSAYSPIICLDNCPTYELPNVFTPNGDGTNDLFVPFPYRNVKSIDLKIYYRWGMLVFETKDPAINWNGHDMITGKLCTDGVYYYTCIVNEVRLQGVVPRELKGFVHLFGK